uniref:HEAT repeat-containing protein 5B n=1 Tax=Tetranychus urticae TaxID=32264 RepID=T1KZX8_TETUR
MESTSKLLLNEAAFNELSGIKKELYILEWLRNLDKGLNSSPKTEIKEYQKQLVEQLLKQITNNPGAPARRLIGRCLATLFNVGDTFLLFEAVNKCNDILKTKDDSPSYLPTRLAATICIGSMYEKLGRLMGRSYEETVILLLKSLKNAESQSRCEIYLTLEKIVSGMGAAAGSLHRDIFKAIRHGITDRVMAVRCNAAHCLKEMLNHAPFLYTTELESVFSLSFRALEESNYEVRCAIAEVLGYLVAITQKPNQPTAVGKNKLATLDEVLNLLALGFLKGGIGFLKGGPKDMIKGGSVVSKETRVGVTHAYVVVVNRLGNHWLEKNMNKYLSHLLELLANPKCSSTHVDAVYARRCIGFVLRSILGKNLGEKSQAQAVKVLVAIINKHINPGLSTPASNQAELIPGGGNNSTNTKENYSIQDIHQIQHVLACALLEIGCILQDLGTSSSSLLTDSSVSVIDTIVSLLTNSSPTVRLAAAWAIRCVAISLPSQLTPLIERCLERLETVKVSPEIIYGYSFALSALLGSSCQTPLSIPHNKGKLIFNIAEDLLRTASQNGRLSLQRTQSGWQLIGGVMALGPSVVRGLLPRMLLLWKNSFPRSSKGLDSEKARGDAFTWQITLENRAGALAAMSSFLTYCEKLVDEDIIRRLLPPIEFALTMLTTLSNIFRNYGPAVKASAALVRLRLYDTLLLLPANSYESSYSNLLRIIVADFTLGDNAINTTTTLLRTLCHPNDEIIIGSWIQETDHRSIEDQLQIASTAGSGAIEHDATALYHEQDKDNFIPSPLPLGYKHRLQILNHFQECIKHERGVRQEAIQINVLAAVLGSLKNSAENKSNIGCEEVKKIITGVIMNLLSHHNPVIRCAAAQGLGRLCYVVGDAKFVAEVAQICFDKLKTARDALSRTGHSLALGCLHRYMGSLGSNQHLNTSISILLALSQDSTSPIVQVWSLHALALIADSGGPMFRTYVEPTLSHSMKLLVQVPYYHCDVHQCIGKLLSAVITTVGPELQSDSPALTVTRSSLLISCGVMQDHCDPLTQSQAIGCLQQLHMFAPKHVNLASLVPMLCSVLNSPHLFLRRSSIACLHQLIQREAKQVCNHVAVWLKEMKNSDTKQFSNGINYLHSDHGLPGILFYFMDHEIDSKILSDIQKIITSLVQSIATENLQSWIALCKEVLCAADPSSSLSTPEKDFEGDGDCDDDESKFKARDDTPNQATAPPKWRTRVFATQTLCRIIQTCENSKEAKAHFDLITVREKKSTGHEKEAFLVHHLSDLIRMSFMAATSDSDQLPQVGAALRPAFSPDTPSHVTAMACQVCSAWIGSKVARDLNDLRRVHQLLVSSLAKLQKDSSSNLYNESASTLEKLAILKAWAEVYIVAMEEEEQRKQAKEKDEENDFKELEGVNESLLHLVKPELLSLSKYWLMALKDHALLTLPSDFSGQLPHDGGAFYTPDTIEVARPIYRQSWPPILHAAALWLCSEGFTQSGENNFIEDKIKNESIPEETRKPLDKANDDETYFPLLFGICMEALCNPKSTEPLSYIIICLRSMETLLTHPYPQSMIGSDTKLAIELCNVLHRLLLTRDNPICQSLILKIALLIMESRRSHLETEKKKKLRELVPANQGPDDVDLFSAGFGEGGENGVINTWESIVYALLEICLCVLVRQLPELCPNLANNPGLVTVLQNRKPPSEEGLNIIGSALKILSALPDLCSPKGSIVVLPTVLYLVTGVLRDVTTKMWTFSVEEEPIISIMESFRKLGSSPLARNKLCSTEWIELLQSSLAFVLDLCKTSSVEPRLDDGLAVTIIGIFITSTPPKVLNAPNLQYPCINLLKQTLQSTREAVVVKCLGTIKLILEVKDDNLKMPYIHALAPRMIELIRRWVTEISDGTSLTKVKFKVITVGLENFELLVSLAETKKRINILALFLPVLINLLLENNPQSRRSSLRYSLHEYALKRLIAIGPNYPEEFKKIIGSDPKFKSKLENAIRNQDKGVPGEGTEDALRNHNRSNNQIIELKTNFSHFT